MPTTDDVVSEGVVVLPDEEGGVVRTGGVILRGVFRGKGMTGGVSVRDLCCIEDEDGSIVKVGEIVLGDGRGGTMLSSGAVDDEVVDEGDENETSK